MTVCGPVAHLAYQAALTLTAVPGHASEHLEDISSWKDHEELKLKMSQTEVTSSPS